MKNKLGLVLHAGFSAFLIYFCMYAFRKPFAAASFSDTEIGGISFKVILVISQVFGYALSKFIGIRFNSGKGMHHRAFYILAFIFLAELALLGFALAPLSWKPLFLFLNGLPLGMIWGLVFAYIEGRTLTEILAAMLSASFILASGVTKSVGKYLMLTYQVSEYWMPFYTGLLFLPPLLLAVWLIERIPPPSPLDTARRRVRKSMSQADRRKMFQRLAPGLISLITLMLLMTAFRDLRDNFSAEFWQQMGYGNSASVFTQTEIFVSAGILLLLSFFILVEKNHQALLLMKGVMLLGMLILLVSTLIFQYTPFNSPFLWMTASGFGVYLTYTTLGGGFVFERISALYDANSNSAFFIYVADAVSYLGSVLVLIVKEIFFPELPFLDYFIQMVYILGIVGLLCTLYAAFYFNRKLGKRTKESGYFFME